MKNKRVALDNIYKNIIAGGYPEVRALKLNPHQWLKSYIQTYVQRDVRQLKNISDLNAFTKLLHLCANQVGQLLNRDELAKKIGIDSKTVQSWISLLEASYILFLLQPWHNNLNKRIIKSPKIYFHDTGLLCSLLQITSLEGLKRHVFMGSIFENWCISEIQKNRANQGLNDGLYYFRDHMGNEIDLIIQKEAGPVAVEIKSSAKANTSLLVGLKYWSKYQPGTSAVLLYQGNDAPTESQWTNYMSWKSIDSLA